MAEMANPRRISDAPTRSCQWSNAGQTPERQVSVRDSPTVAMIRLVERYGSAPNAGRQDVRCGPELRRETGRSSADTDAVRCKCQLPRVVNAAVTRNRSRVSVRCRRECSYFRATFECTPDSAE